MGGDRSYKSVKSLELLRHVYVTHMLWVMWYPRSLSLIVSICISIVAEYLKICIFSIIKPNYIKEKVQIHTEILSKRPPVQNKPPKHNASWDCNRITRFCTNLYTFLWLLIFKLRWKVGKSKIIIFAAQKVYKHALLYLCVLRYYGYVPNRNLVYRK